VRVLVVSDEVGRCYGASTSTEARSHQVPARIEELAWRATPLGDISLRRRRDPVLDVDVYEVKLGDEFLMSSLFTVAEVALARLGLAAASGTELDVVVGGLGLGYTARAALDDVRVASVTVVEALGEVLDWHRKDLLPDTVGLAADRRIHLVEGDFFALVRDDGFDRDQSGRRFDAILLDVDHTPRHHLHASHAAFYSADGLRSMARFLRPGGVFALWSDDPPDSDVEAVLGEVFGSVEAHVVDFANHLTGGRSANTVYVAC
jgi:spermidine synthase